MDLLIKQLKDIRYQENVSFKTLTSFKTGGKASLVVYPKSIKEVKYILKLLKKYKIDYALFGNGTNILASDDDYNGVVIKLNDLKIYNKNKKDITVSSGYSLSKLCFDLTKEGYKGYTFGVGIPGTIGGAVYMNAGAYGEEIKDIVKYIVVYYKGFVFRISNKHLKFAKRYSILQKMNNPVVLSATLKLEKTNENLIEKVKYNQEKRKNTQPLEFPNAGSIFKNPQDIPAGKLIEELGLKGYQVGGAMVSKKHANFIINEDNATSLDILNIIQYIQMKALNERNINLELELQLFNF